MSRGTATAAAAAPQAALAGVRKTLSGSPGKVTASLRTAEAESVAGGAATAKAAAGATVIGTTRGGEDVASRIHLAPGWAPLRVCSMQGANPIRAAYLRAPFPSRQRSACQS